MCWRDDYRPMNSWLRLPATEPCDECGQRAGRTRHGLCGSCGAEKKTPAPKVFTAPDGTLVEDEIY